MERLTKIDGIGKNECIKCFGCGPEKAGAELEHCGYCEHWQQILDRLTVYELYQSQQLLLEEADQ